MALDRRRFLTGVAAGVAAGGALPFSSSCATDRGSVDGEEAPSAPLVGADGEVDWRAVRSQFDLRPDWLHFGSFYLVSHPRPVREAIERYRRRLDEDPLWLEEAMFAGAETNLWLRAKQALARYLGGSADEIALTPNTTTGLALVYNGLRIRSDQEILTTEHDHYVHHESIRRSAEKSGATVRFVALHDGGETATREEIVARARDAIGPKTRAFGVTWVHSSTGLKLPIPAIAEVVAEANRGRSEADRCLLVVDGVHGFGVEDAEVASLGADFFCAGTHKWLFAPRGTGLIWARAGTWPQVRPTVPSFDLSPALWSAWTEREPLPPTRASFVAPGGFLAYEHHFAVADALEFHLGLGRARIAARLRELNGRVREGLARLPGVTLHTPLDAGLAAGINCFEVAGMSALDVVRRLAERRIHATDSPYPVSYARLAAGIMNFPEEIDVALAAVGELARGAA